MRPADILDTSRPFDDDAVKLLDGIVAVMFSGSANERQEAHKILTELKSRDDSWRLVGKILQSSKDLTTKHFALSILENCISKRWNVLPEDQKEGLKQYVTELALTSAVDPELSKTPHYIAKINETLIAIVKKEWPNRWPRFIGDVCESARSTQALCENNLNILSLLAEEVFEFGEEGFTSKKAATLKSMFSSQFSMVFELCMFILTNDYNEPGSVDPNLLSTTLDCLARFIRWMPTNYVFETSLISTLLTHFWSKTEYRISVIKCATEIVCIKDINDAYMKPLADLFSLLLTNIKKLPPRFFEPDDQTAPSPFATKLYWDTLSQHVAICLTSILRHYPQVVKTVANGETLAVQFLVCMANSAVEDTFLLLMEFFHWYSESMFLETLAHIRQEPHMELNAESDEEVLDDQPKKKTTARPVPLENPQIHSRHLTEMQEVLTQMRQTLVTRMAKPEEVYVTYDEESGCVDKYYRPDTAEIALYHIMRETLIFLTNLGGEEMESVLTFFLMKERENDPMKQQWNPQPLNRLCWSVGSISGAMSPQRERKFLIVILGELLKLCEIKKGKDNKAVVASQVMYVIGQYPRFLKSYWKFFHTLLSKLFEFMEEAFPGVQDMACETLLKICKKCRKELGRPVPSGPDARGPYVIDLMNQLSRLLSSLSSAKQVLWVFEAIAWAISAADPPDQVQYIQMLLSNYNQEIVALCEGNLRENRGRIAEILRINNRIVLATKSNFSPQMSLLYPYMQKVFTHISEILVQEMAQRGTAASSHHDIKQLRNVKREILSLLEIFVQSVPAQEVQFLPTLLQPMLRDYYSNIPDNRDYEVLNLLSACTEKLPMDAELPQVYEFILDPTLAMIKNDFDSYPDHRVAYYELLDRTVKNNFPGLLRLSDEPLQALIHSLVWACRHRLPSLAEKGLKIILRFLIQVSKLEKEAINSFYCAFWHTLVREILSVFTDGFHKSGKAVQISIFRTLLVVIDSEIVQDTSKLLTREQCMGFLAMNLREGFPNLNKTQIESIVLDLMTNSQRPSDFKRTCQDLLVQLKEISGEDVSFQEEKMEALKRAQEAAERRKYQIPGVMPVHDPEGDFTDE
eukprot:GHVP01031273.1.p1 GENE.GHVP01031273.1~~GHVP01031273.1.p1  ORF type:complete len:1088 (-),score=200.61 GHVP01031273.1:2483-5746(-)